MAMIFKRSLFKGEAVPFVMELPNYRLPGAKNVAQLLWEKAKDFLQRAFTVIFGATIVIWFLQTFNLQLSMVTDSKDSISGISSRHDRTDLRTTWFWRLEDFNIPDSRIYGKGKRCLYLVGVIWKYGDPVAGNFTAGSSVTVGILSVVYSLRCCDSIY